MAANWTDGTSPCTRCGASKWGMWTAERPDVRVCGTCGNLATHYAIKSAERPSESEVLRPMLAPIEHPREAKFTGRYFEVENDTTPRIRVRETRER